MHGKTHEGHADDKRKERNYSCATAVPALTEYSASYTALILVDGGKVILEYLMHVMYDKHVSC
jgi:hypothetical protein